VLLLTLLGMTGSIGTVAYTIGAPTIVPRLVPAGELARANGQLELCRSVAIAAGPALGGLLVGQTGAPLAFLIAISLSSVALVLIVAIPRTSAGVAHSARPMQQVREGGSFVWRDPYLRPIVLTAVLFNTAWFCLQGVYVAYAIDRLGMSTGQTGMTLALYGVGMIIGTRLAGVLARRVTFGTLIVIGPLCGATASLLMLGTLVWPVLILPSSAFLLLGMGPIIWTISTTTLRQVITPAAMLGRVTALIVTSTAGFRPIGAGLGALAYVAGGYQLALGVSCVGFVAQALVILRSEAARIVMLPEIP
jgi:predicted MFS family arabinose efflux permease